MAKQARVAVLMRIKEAGKRPYVKPVKGQEMYRPEVTYYLEIYPGRQEPFGACWA